MTAGSNAKSQLRSWRKFYEKFFGIKLDISKVKVPAREEGFGWLIVLVKGLSNEQIYAKLKENFPCWKDIDNLDRITSARVNTETYAIWVRDRVEADEELKGRSANDLKRDNVNCITLPERMILELYYWSKTGQHLDLQNITICGGSRDSVGGVPYVRWGGGAFKLDVYWHYSDDHNDSLRSRLAVS